MGRPIADILEKLGAEQEGDDAWALDGAALGVESVFGGDLGPCRITLFSEQAFGFAEPPEMAALGVLWVANVERADDVRSAVRDAHGRLKNRLESDRAVMSTGGYTAELEMPEPEITAATSAAGYDVRIAINPNGGLEVRNVSGRPVPAKSRLALEDTADADKAALRQAVLDVVRKLKDAGLLTGRGVFDAPTVRAPIGEDDSSEQEPSVADRDAGEAKVAEDETSAVEQAEQAEKAEKAEKKGADDKEAAAPSAESTGVKKAPPRPRRRSRRSREGEAASEASQAPAVDASEPDASQVESLLPAPSDVVDKVEQHSAEADLGDDDGDFDWEDDATRQVGPEELAKAAAGELGGPTAQASAPSMSEVGLDLDDLSDEAPSELVDDEVSDLADAAEAASAAEDEDDDEGADHELAAARASDDDDDQDGELEDVEDKSEAGADDDGEGEDDVGGVDDDDDGDVADEETRLKGAPPDVTMQGGPPSAASDSSASLSSEDSSDDASELSDDGSVDASLEGDPDASDDDIMAALEEFSSEEESAEGSEVEDAEVSVSADEPSADADGFDDGSEEGAPPDAEAEQVSDSQLMSLPSASAEQLPDDADDDSMRPTGPIPVVAPDGDEAPSESRGKPQTSDEEVASKPATGEQSDPWRSGLGSGPPSEHVAPFKDSGSGSDEVDIDIDEVPPEIEVGTPPPEMDVGTGPVPAVTPSAENTYQNLADVVGDGLRTGKTGAFVLDADAFAQLQEAGAEQELAELMQEEAELEARLAAVRSRLVVLRAGKAQVELLEKEETSAPKRRLAEKMARLRSQKSQEGAFATSGEDVSITGPGEGPSSAEGSFEEFDEDDPYTRPIEVSPEATAQRPPMPLPSAATPTDVQAGAPGADGSSEAEEAFADGVRVEDLEAELGDGATQMVESPLAAADLDDGPSDDEGGVFESPSSASVSVASSAADAEDEDLDEDINPDGATRVAFSPLLSDDDEGDKGEAAAPSGPPPVGLVVQDTRALARLRKHLAPRIPGLVEIGDLDAVADHDDLESLAALVFVRPRKDTKTLDTLTALSTLDPAPRTLVLSSDTGFDEAEGVGLRLKLAKRVADVAQQVVDGLADLGISSDG